MANKSALTVVAGAMTMLVVAFSLLAGAAMAEGSISEPIDMIYSIKLEALGGIDEVVTRAETEITEATSKTAAREAHDDAQAEVAELYSDALDNMWAVVLGTDGDPDVEAAYWEAQGVLEARTTAAAGEITGFYEYWVSKNAQGAAEVIADMALELAKAANEFDAIVAGFGVDLAEAKTEEGAAVARDEALIKVADQVEQTREALGLLLQLLPDDPDVQGGYAQAISDLESAAADASATINGMFTEWEPPAPPTTTTTTTTLSSPPKTVPPATTTTTTTTSTTSPPATTTLAPTTTTTSTIVAAAIQIEPFPPQGSELAALMPHMPAPVFSSAANESGSATEAGPEMMTVGFVQRVVNSQLPAGVAAVAAGPLVVLGLIIDAIHAAGALMVVPWTLLTVYMVGLLWNRRTTGLVAARVGS